MPAQAWAIPTLAAAIRQVAKEQGHDSIPDSLVALILAQICGAEGAYPGCSTFFAGTNNIGATDVTAGFWKAHTGTDVGWGAFAAKDTDPNRGPFCAWFYVAPSPIAAVRAWFGNWWGAQLLSQQPETPTDYATLLYRGGYFGGMAQGDPNHNGLVNGQPDATAQDAYTKNIAAYANNIAGSLGSMTAQMANTAAAIDPNTVNVASSFADLQDQSTKGRRITQALYNAPTTFRAILGSAFPPTWDAMVACNGVVWCGTPPSGFGGLNLASIPGWAPVAIGAAGGIAIIGGMVAHHLLEEGKSKRR